MSKNQKGRKFNTWIIVLVVILIVTIFVSLRTSSKSEIKNATTQNSSPIDVSNSPNITNVPITKNAKFEANTPEDNVNKFYNWYLMCLDNHFKQQNGKSPAEDCDPLSNQYVDVQLTKNTHEKNGNLLCARNTPMRFSVDSTVTQDNKASTVVHTYYGESGDNPLYVELQKVNGAWKITNVLCTR